MPELNKENFLKPIGLSVWVNGPAGSGKTRLAAGFPDVFAITFDPTGLDVLKQPENRALLDNVVWQVPLNGLPLDSMFLFTEEPGETGIYAALALARKLAAEGKVKTVLLDGFTYMAQLKWTQLCEKEGIDPSNKDASSRKNADQRGMYDALGSYLDHLVLQNLLPMTTRNNLNVVVTCHVQRESKNTVEGLADAKNPDLVKAAKRLVNLDSDLSAQVLGGFRQRIDGLPSALIYLEERLMEKDGKEVSEYYAYCKMTRSPTMDTVIKAKNRFGLGTLKLTNANFYKTLCAKIQSGNGQQPTTTKTKETTK